MMTCGSGGARRAFVLSSLTATLACGAAGCLLGDDDNLAAYVPPVDAAASDAPPADGSHGDAATGDGASSDGASSDGKGADADAARDAAADVAVAIDATLEYAETGPATTEGGVPKAVFSPASVDFGAVSCGDTATQSLLLQNAGGGTLAISAMTVGGAFSVSPGSVTLGPGASQTLAVTTQLGTDLTAGVAVQGSLHLFTTDPNASSLAIPLSASPQGARLDFLQAGLGQSDIAFPSTRVGTSSTVDVTLENYGNAPITVAGAKVASSLVATYSVVTAIPASGVTIAPGQTWPVTMEFTAPATLPASGTTGADATLNLTTTGVTCGKTLTSFKVQGDSTNASISGFPSGSPPTLDFGNVNCGGSLPPAQQTFTLSNTSSVPATISAAIQPAAGFAINFPLAPQSVTIPPDGSLDILVSAPAFPRAPAGLTPGQMPGPIQATLTITSPDSTPASTSIVLTEEPSGSSLAWVEPSGFGTFATPSVLLQSQSQTFSLVNKGSTAAPPAGVTLQLQTTEGAALGDPDGGAPPPFTVTTPGFFLPSGSTQSETLSFMPIVAGPSQATLAVAVAPGTFLCAPLPAPIMLSGGGVGAGPDVSPMSLQFNVPCNGTAVTTTQSFTVGNVGPDAARDLNWQMSPSTGPGAANYSIISVSKLPGLLHPGDSSTITIGVTNTIPSAVPSADGGAPPVAPTPAALAAQIAITTDVPYYNPVVSLGEIPIGDQLNVAVGNLGFSQVPLGQTTQQTFSVTNSAASGNQPANVSFTVNGAGYSTPAAITVPAGGSATASLGFSPSTPGSYQGTIALTTTDALCAPLPQPVVLQGTGTQGAPVLSRSTIAFGPVNCGSTAQPQTFTVANQGNQPFNVTGATLQSTMSAAGTFYSVLDQSGNPLPQSLSIPLGIGSTPITFTVQPQPIPVPTAPDDATPFNDTLTITTDIPNDPPHTIALSMQPVGSVLSFPLTLNPSPWDFGTVGFGSIGSLPTPVANTGNDGATLSLSGLIQPNIFFLAGATVAPNSTSSVVAEFAPPAQNGSWGDEGTLIVTASQAFCSAPPPGWQLAPSSTTVWQGPMINFLGSSSSDKPVTASGSLAFGATECGSPPPASQAITLGNQTNQPLPFVVTLQQGTHYTVTTTTDAGLSTGDAGTGLLPANGVAVVTVTPQAVTPGPGVLPGASLYGDGLVISVGSSSPPIWTSTLPITWQLDGAVLSLPATAGDHSAGGAVNYYVADSTAAHTIPVTNSGNETANVDFVIPSSPTGANFTVQPTAPIAVPPGPSTLVHLLGAGSAPACSTSSPGPNTTLTLVATGHVCQPLTVSTVKVQACAGSLN